MDLLGKEGHAVYRETARITKELLLDRICIFLVCTVPYKSMQH